MDKTNEYLELLDDANNTVVTLKKDLRSALDSLKGTEHKLGVVEGEFSREVQLAMCGLLFTIGSSSAYCPH